MEVKKVEFLFFFLKKVEFLSAQFSSLQLQISFIKL